ncbi:uracil-DNA glycosylase family protein [Roseobacter sp. HKCCA0434]|uniref:uracil-DNA glycosylase family protein n=1 Tax=Roseobacter sp. HKCCA0434 TaxID=3079297 RepID=UPI002905CDAA|nr:uracil-DNA glycosylase family protein [Roseobacter sp. HKCCA0434]
MSVAAFEEEVRACRICAERFAATATQHRPRPVPWLSDRAPVLIVGQAPGMRVHLSGKPFDDRSGDRLRDWLGVDRAAFYDRDRFAILPMAFCFPGYDARGSDLPPPKVCAATWRERALGQMPQIRVRVLIGAHAQAWHLGTRGRLTDTVARWREFGPETFPLPHPSWRNTGWLKRNPWFDTEVVPALRDAVSLALARADGQTGPHG